MVDTITVSKPYTIRTQRFPTVAYLALLLLPATGACDDANSDADRTSYTTLASALQQPAGQLAAEYALPLADIFQQAATCAPEQWAANQEHLPLPNQDGSLSHTVRCAASGSYTLSADGPAPLHQTTVRYDECCSTDDCCISGRGERYYPQQDASPGFAYCDRYEVTLTCNGDERQLPVSGCFDGSAWRYHVSVSDQTFSVSGTYRDGIGALRIKDVQGQQLCAYADYHGTCEGNDHLQF